MRDAKSKPLSSTAWHNSLKIVNVWMLILLLEHASEGSWDLVEVRTWRIIIRPLLFSAWKPLPEYFNNQMRVLRICLPSPRENSYKIDAGADGGTKITGLLTWRQRACRGRPNEKARDLKRSDGNSRGGEKKQELIPSGSCTSSHLTNTAQNVSHVWIHTTQSLFSGIIDCFQTRRKAKGQSTFWLKSPSSSSHRRRTTSSVVVWKTWSQSNKVMRSWEYYDPSMLFFLISSKWISISSWKNNIKLDNGRFLL